jgi:hypothetical protein
MKIYYAHCLALYHTPQEARDIVILQLLGFDVENPNQLKHQDGYKSAGSMDYFKELVDDCDAVAFRALPDGSIPGGVALEVQHAIDTGKPVIELPCGFKRRSLDVDLTREYLRDAGQR